MKRDRRTGAVVVAAAGVPLIAVVAYTLLRDAEAEPPAGYETNKTLRRAGLRFWNVLKQRDFQPPDGFKYRGDEWGQALDVHLDACQLKDIPAHLLQGRQLDPPDEIGYLIIVTSKGPDGHLDTDDDLTFWRINSVEDGYLKGQGEVYNEDVWPELTAYLRYIRGAASTGGG